MIDPQDLLRLADSLTVKQREALKLFSENYQYGTGCPAGVSPSVKGRLTTLGILKRIWLREVGGGADHALTPLGLALKARAHSTKDTSNVG